jgi:hypothetical protein
MSGFYGESDGRDGSLVEVLEKHREKFGDDFLFVPQQMRTKNDLFREIEEQDAEFFDGCLKIGCMAKISSKALAQQMEVDTSVMAVVVVNTVSGISSEIDFDLPEWGVKKILITSEKAPLGRDLLKGGGLGHLIYTNENNGGIEIDLDVLEIKRPIETVEILKKAI